MGRNFPRYRYYRGIIGLYRHRRRRGRHREIPVFPLHSRFRNTFLACDFYRQKSALVKSRIAAQSSYTRKPHDARTVPHPRSAEDFLPGF